MALFNGGQSLPACTDEMRHSLLLFICGSNHLIDARHQDLSRWFDEFAHQVDEIGHGLVDSPAKDTRVQVAARASNGDFEVGQATETVGEAGRPVVQPVVVRLWIQMRPRSS